MVIGSDAEERTQASQVGGERRRAEKRKGLFVWLVFVCHLKQANIVGASCFGSPSSSQVVCGIHNKNKKNTHTHCQPILEGLRNELEAHFGVDLRDQVGSKPFQAIAEDHLQLHWQPHRNIHEPTPPGKFWQRPSLSRHLLQQSITTKHHNAEHLSCLSRQQTTRKHTYSES